MNIDFYADFILPIAIGVLLYCLFDKIYIRRYRSKYLYFVAYIVYILFIRIVNVWNIPFLNIASVFIATNAIGYLLYTRQGEKRFLYNNLIVFILFFCDITSVAVWMIIGNSGFSEVINYFPSKIICSLINVLLLVLVEKIIVVFLCKSEITAVRWRETIFFIMLTIFEMLYIGVFAIRSSTREDGIVIVILLAGFIVLNLVFTNMIKQISDAQKYKYELSLMKMQNEMQMLHYHELNEQYKESGKIVHDIKKHLSAIRTLEGTDKERAEEYFHQLGAQMEELFCNFHCQNTMLSIVLSQKISYAEKKHIVVKTNIEDLSLSFIKDMDITAIFANLWDNAIEACDKLPDENERYIVLQLKHDKGCIFIRMENSFDGVVKMEKNDIISTKTNHIGLGIQIIQSAVEKYQGIFTSETRGKKFISVITIPDNQKGICFR